MKVINVVGARPNFMKIAPLHRALQQDGAFESMIVHTGQHYDEQMSDVFFRQLELPEPDRYLGVGSGTHAQQTARVMTAFESVVEEEAPDLVIVVGDVNSTLACSLVAVKQHVPVAHVEAGLRSGDRRMPEEINRIVTDSISDLLFVTEESAIDNLQREGIGEEKIVFVGNVMIDALVQFQEKAAETTILEDLDLPVGEYVLMTMHRPSNVDHKAGIEEILRMIRRIDRPVVFPIHPRTQQRFEAFDLADALTAVDHLILQEPLGYLEFLQLMRHAAAVITDSGGIQEETTYLQVPCLTLRPSTERPVTVTQGTNTLLPLDATAVTEALQRRIDGSQGAAQRPPRWDGKAAERIVDILRETWVAPSLA